jgi:2-dehydro-3-deoxygluconokinase
MGKIVTLGEMMLRLSTPGNKKFEQSDVVDAKYCGGECNVAVQLANYGHHACFVTKLPENEIGQCARNTVRQYGVDTQYIRQGGKRLGVYYCEIGAALRHTAVVYDRAGSSFAEAVPEDFDFDDIMNGADWFHWSGIDPALSDGTAEITRLACEAAKRHGATVSCDLNYRASLWSPEKAQSVMKPLMKYVDVCINSVEDGQYALGAVPPADNSEEEYRKLFRSMCGEYGFRYIAHMVRESYSCSHYGWYGFISDGNEIYRSRHDDILPIVEAVGVGDSFSGGIIHGFMKWHDMRKALEFALAASALKHSIPGDFTLFTEEEVMNLVNGDSSGRVQR